VPDRIKKRADRLLLGIPAENLHGHGQSVRLAIIVS
jgi:hypothetical protein